MDIKRFFVSPTDKCGEEIFINGEELAHLTKVLRYKVGYKAVISMGDGLDYWCTITHIDKSQAVAHIDQITVNESVPSVEIVLCQALPKGDKLDLIVQKAVELGVSEIVPFRSQFVAENKFNGERLARISMEASKQCGRAEIVKVGDLVDFDQMLQYIKDCDIVILPYENASCGKIGNVQGLDNAHKIAIVVGSEGGFDESEVGQAKSMGAQIVSLGKRILRCETAAIVATSLVLYEKGELSQ